MIIGTIRVVPIFVTSRNGNDEVGYVTIVNKNFSDRHHSYKYLPTIILPKHFENARVLFFPRDQKASTITVFARL